MKYSPFLLFFAVLTLFSCKRDKPENGKAKITVTGLDISKPKDAGARVLATEEWTHSYPSSYTLVFTSQETSDTYSVQISTDFQNSPPSFELPLGNYSYESSASMASISTTLPVLFGGNLQVNASQVSTRLQGVSDYQLISIQKQNIEKSPLVLLPSQGNMGSNGQHYYIYAKNGVPVKTEIPLLNGETFRWGWDAEDFSHDHYTLVKASGDTDPLAISDRLFDLQSAKITLKDDHFPELLFPFALSELSSQINETSGLQWIGNRLFTFNDGGNAAELYELNPETGVIIRTIQISNASNVDWEDIAASSTHLFIGDFGNNSGNRKDLKVLKIPITEVVNQTSVTAETINFYYPDQSQFDQANHRFDCEAMAFWGEKLHLFTKPTDSYDTQEYVLSPNAGSQAAVKGASFATPGKLTGVDISPDGKNLAFIGHDVNGLNSKSFVFIFPDFDQGSSLSGQNSISFSLGSVSRTSQTEGIAILSSEKIKISGEQISLNGLSIPPRWMELDLKGIFED